MRFLDKPVDRLTMVDLDELRSVERPEGLYLEFKRDIGNRQVARSVAAFANTHGGRLLLGVEADKQKNIITGIPGLPLVEGLQERVKNLVLDSITPVPLFEPQLIEVGSGRVVMVVDVPESPNAPHLLRSSGQLYVRTPVSSDPVPADDRATVDRLYARSEAARDRVDSWIEEQFSRFYSLTEGRSVLVFQSLIPIWSGTPLLPNLLRRSVAERYEATLYDGGFPWVGRPFLPDQTGIWSGKVDTMDRSGGILRLDQNGGVTYASFASSGGAGMSNSLPYIDVDYLSDKLARLLPVSGKICDSIGFYGGMRLTMTIAPTEQLGLRRSGSASWPTVALSLTRGRLDIERILPVAQLREDPGPTVRSVTRELERAFGHLSYEPEGSYA